MTDWSMIYSILLGVGIIVPPVGLVLVAAMRWLIYSANLRQNEILRAERDKMAKHIDERFDKLDADNTRGHKDLWDAINNHVKDANQQNELLVRTVATVESNSRDLARIERKVFEA